MVNLVVLVEKGVADGTVEKGTKIFIFTDNFVTECAFYRGTSEWPNLRALVLRLRVLKINRCISPRIIWVANKDDEMFDEADAALDQDRYKMARDGDDLMSVQEHAETRPERDTSRNLSHIVQDKLTGRRLVKGLEP